MEEVSGGDEEVTRKYRVTYGEKIWYDERKNRFYMVLEGKVTEDSTVTVHISYFEFESWHFVRRGHDEKTVRFLCK